MACNSECAVMERNRRLALALEIKNPDLSSKLGNPTYSQFLKDYARQNPTFVASVEKALSELVTAANQVCHGWLVFYDYRSCDMAGIGLLCQFFCKHVLISGHFWTQL